MVGIPFKVDQHRQQYLQAVDEQYTIGVPAKFFEKARKAVSRLSGLAWNFSGNPVTQDLRKIVM